MSSARTGMGLGSSSRTRECGVPGDAPECAPRVLEGGERGGEGEAAEVGRTGLREGGVLREAGEEVALGELADLEEMRDSRTRLHDTKGSRAPGRESTKLRSEGWAGQRASASEGLDLVMLSVQRRGTHLVMLSVQISRAVGRGLDDADAGPLSVGLTPASRRARQRRGMPRCAATCRAVMPRPSVAPRSH